MRQTSKIFILCAVALGLISQGGVGEIVRVDFGTEKSPVRNGFLLVTENTVFKDGVIVGWENIEGLAAKDVPISREWKENISRGRSEPPPIYTTDLRQDHVESARPAVLRVRVPDGNYRVWLLCGSAGGSPSQVWDVTVEHGSIGESATFAGPYECRVLRLRALAKSGVLDLRFRTRSRWLVNAMLVVPEREWPEAKAHEIAKIEQEIFLLPDDILKNWKHTPHEEKNPMPKPTPEEERRGFMVYHRPWLVPIWPNTVPKREECDPTLRAFASRDEYEPLTFTILPLKDFGEFSVELSDLVTAEGHTILRSAMELRYVRYMYVRPNYSAMGTYYRAPDVLMPFRTPQPLVKGENFTVWMTLYVDPCAPAGLYKGHAKILVGGEHAASVPILFRVLPIKLQKDLSIVYGHYYRHPYGLMATAPDAFSREWWRRKAELEFADMAAHGNNTITTGIGGRMDAARNWIMDFDTFDQRLDLCRRHGFDKPLICSIPTGYLYRKHMNADMGSHLRLIKMPPKEFFDDLTRMIRTIEDGRKRYQWPELLYYPVDEPSTAEASVQFMVETLKAIKQVPGARTYVTADPVHPEFAPMMPYVDVWCCQPFSLPRETILADMQKRGVEYWCYPNHVSGENDHTTVAGARMTYGFGFWRSGFRALTPWIYQSISGDQWNYLDGPYMDFFNRTDDDASPIPVMMWEAYREGIDDGRYITTLQRWIERARSAGHTKAADKADAELKFVWDTIPVMTKYKYDVGWEAESFDVYRWLLARQILELQELVTSAK